jgi:hypothetical protein
VSEAEAIVAAGETRDGQIAASRYVAPVKNVVAALIRRPHQVPAVSAEIDKHHIVVRRRDDPRLAAGEVVIGDGGEIATLVAEHVETRTIGRPGEAAVAGGNGRIEQRPFCTGGQVEDGDVVGRFTASLLHQ